VAADNLPDALADFLRVRLASLSHADAVLVAESFASAFRLGAAWSAQHGLVLIASAAASSSTLQAALEQVCNGLALVAQQALAGGDELMH